MGTENEDETGVIVPKSKFKEGVRLCVKSQSRWQWLELIIPFLVRIQNSSSPFLTENIHSHRRSHSSKKIIKIIFVKESELRGVPGILYYKFVRDTIRSYTDRVLLVVDSTNPDALDEVMAHLDEARNTFPNMPIEIIAKKKQDREDAVAPETVAQWLKVEGLRALLQKILLDTVKLLVNLLKSAISRKVEQLH